MSHKQRVVASAISVSLDGYMAGPRQSLEAPLGVGGERLHEWAFATKAFRRSHGLDRGAEGIDNDWARRSTEGIGATVMGRNMFGPIRGSWTGDWRGWWGDDPPYHHPVFVLTHHARPALVMDGGTTFHFVTGGIHEALERAKEAAGTLDVRVGGGAATIRQCLAAGLMDELHVVFVPTLLGRGERLFDGSLESVPDRYVCTVFEAAERTLHLLISRMG